MYRREAISNDPNLVSALNEVLLWFVAWFSVSGEKRLSKRLQNRTLKRKFMGSFGWPTIWIFRLKYIPSSDPLGLSEGRRNRYSWSPCVDSRFAREEPLGFDCSGKGLRNENPIIKSWKYKLYAVSLRTWKGLTPHFYSQFHGESARFSVRPLVVLNMRQLMLSRDVCALFVDDFRHWRSNPFLIRACFNFKVWKTSCRTQTDEDQLPSELNTRKNLKTSHELRLTEREFSRQHTNLPEKKITSSTSSSVRNLSTLKSN